MFPELLSGERLSCGRMVCSDPGPNVRPDDDPAKLSRCASLDNKDDLSDPDLDSSLLELPAGLLTKPSTHSTMIKN